MQAVRRVFRVLSVLTFGLCVLQAASGAPDQSVEFRLSIELQDGSKIIGKSGEENFQFRSPVLGEMKLPVGRIRSINSFATTNGIELTTANGDSLSAQFVTEAIRVETAFGSVKLPVRLIKRLTVLPAGKSGRTREGLVALWSGEGDGNDTLGACNGRLLNGVTFTNGEVGLAFSFRGGADGEANPCVEIPYFPGLAASNFSVEAWIDPMGQVNNSGNQSWIFGESQSVQLNVRPGTTGVRVVFQFKNASGGFPSVVSTSDVPIGQFSQVVGTWDGTTLRLYLNGLLNNQAVPRATPVFSGCEIFIGGTYHLASDECQTVGQFFNGYIDEVGYYNRVLGDAEIQANYEAGRSGH